MIEFKVMVKINNNNNNFLEIKKIKIKKTLKIF